MKRAVVPTVLVVFLLVVGAAVIAISRSTGTSLGATQDPRRGCTGCHEKVSELVPQNHFKVGLEESTYCLICHSMDGPAVAFKWVVHLDHYSKPEFAGDCWSCHPIVQAKGFGLLESGNGQRPTEATRDVVEKMIPYFRSWAASAHLDNRHARRSVTCRVCHGISYPQERPTMAQCLQCHGGYQELAALTNGVSPNPHEESHLGEIACTCCHKAHQKSILLCRNCHVFALEVP